MQSGLGSKSLKRRSVMQCKRVSIIGPLASAAILALTTTTATAATDQRRTCLLGLTLFGQSIDVGCFGKSDRAAQASIRKFCGPKGSGKPFQPMAWSKRDTPETIDEAREHNAAGRKVGCWK